MSDSTDHDLAQKYQPVLQADREALLTASADTEETRLPVILDQTSVGRLSRMDAMQGQAMAAAIEVRRAGRIRAIDAALIRLDEGEFGWCEDCGEFIGWGRLDVDPTAIRCVSCAS